MAGLRRDDDRAVSDAALGGLADGADVHDTHVGDLALERHVAAAAHDDVPRLVAEQREDLVVGHVEAQGLTRIRRRAVHDEHRVSRLERQRRLLRQLAETSDDELSELLMRLLEPLDARALDGLGSGELGRIHLRERTVADALHTERAMLDEYLPHAQRIRPGKTQVTARDELIPAERVRLAQHGLERTRVPVDVRDAEKPHESACREEFALRGLLPWGAYRNGVVYKLSFAGESARHPGAMDELNRLAERIDAERAGLLAQELGARPVAILLGTAFPPLTATLGWQVDALDEIAARGWRAERHQRELAAGLRPRAPSAGAAEDLLSPLRRRVWAEKARVALRELLPVELGGAEIESTARELSLLADAALEGVLELASSEVAARFGPPLRADGGRSVLTVFGMGKLGGLELNAGSDVDLLFVYDTDDGRSERSLHEHWTQVVRRLVELFEAPTADGPIWRVDLRLRPEGSGGALVNSADAAERYYARWGRLWERAALLKARPSAGDQRFGRLVEREIIHPFVFRRAVEPQIAAGMTDLVKRSRAELSPDPRRDLKLGEGGIREAEFFVQTLELVWGGRDPTLRARGTLAGIARLKSRGLVSDAEARAVGEAYVLLRRLEHRVQWMSGLQTHLLPKGDQLGHLARTLSVAEKSLTTALARARDAVHDLFLTLAPGANTRRRRSPFEPLVAHLGADRETLERAVEAAYGNAEIGDHLLALARRPDALLGELTRERHPDLALAVLEELGGASDPEQAAAGLRRFFGRFSSAEPYFAALATDRLALRRMITAFASSAFVRDAVLGRPELADVIVFGAGNISDPEAAVEIEIEVQAQILSEDAGDAERRDSLIAGLRIAKQRVMLEVATADLAGSLFTHEATRLLAALADEQLGRAMGHVLGERGGLAVLAMGKLGGRELGYGSDLDVLFVYDPEKAPDPDEAAAFFSRRAQAVIRLISEPHVTGPGYELDTRLRPSGSQGMLVTSLEAFARYHAVPLGTGEPAEGAVGATAASWERQALLRARFAAGDAELGTRAQQIAERAAYGGPPPEGSELHRMRLRLQRELGRERADRRDLKAGRGGLLDVEFAVQYLQMRHGHDPRVHTQDTADALEALATQGYIDFAEYEPLREGYRFLRRVEQRLHVERGRSSSVLETEGPALRAVARSLGYRDGPETPAATTLLARYHDSHGTGPGRVPARARCRGRGVRPRPREALEPIGVTLERRAPARTDAGRSCRRPAVRRAPARADAGRSCRRPRRSSSVSE